MTINLKPLSLTPEFVREFKALGKQVGYRRLGRAIAYAVVLPPLKDSKAIIVRNGNGSKPHSRRNKVVHHWACNTKRSRACGYLTCACQRGEITTRAHDLAEWLTLPPMGIYPSYRLPQGQEADHGYANRCKQVATFLAKHQTNQHYVGGRVFLTAAPRCCNTRMGVSPDFTDPAHWRYQCAVNPTHHRDTEIVIWVKAQKEVAP